MAINGIDNSNDDILPQQPQPDLSNSGLGNIDNQSFTKPNEQVDEAKYSAPFNEKVYHTVLKGRNLILGQNLLPTITNARGSEYTNNIAKALKEIYKTVPNGLGVDAPQPIVTIFDKEKTPGIAYSCIVVSIKTDDIRFFTIQLEATGRRTITAGEIINELSNTSKNPQAKLNIYTADDGIDPMLNSIIAAELFKIYNAPIEEFASVDGVVLHATHPEFETIASDLARIAFNACVADSCINTKEFKDLNLVESLKASPEAKYIYKANISKNQSYTELGRPVRADFKIDLYQSIKYNNTYSINSQAHEIPCSRTCGYIDLLPEEFYTTPAFPGQFVSNNAPKVVRYHPHIIITSVETTQPTIGYLLLGIANALVMTNSSLWLAALKPTDPKNNIGVLNVDAKIDGGVGEKLNLTSKEYDIQRVYNSIQQMVSLSPVVSIDIESFGPQTFFTSILAKAASSHATQDRENSRLTLLHRVRELTNGHFPAEYPTNEIFSGDSVIIPLGKWSDKSGERDIRDVDYIFIANHTDDKSLLNQYTTAEAGIGYQNLDTFLTKTAILNKFISSAEIISKGIRVTFSSRFINELTIAIMKTGLNVQYTPEIVQTTDNNLSLMAAYYANAGLNGYHNGFITPFTPSQPNYSAGYSNIGYARRW